MWYQRPNLLFGDMVGVVRSFQSPFRNFLACCFSIEPENIGIGGFWYNKQIARKKQCPSQCQLVLLNTPFIRRVLLTVKHGFSALYSETSG